MLCLPLLSQNMFMDYKTKDSKLTEAIELYETIQFDEAEKRFLEIITVSKERMDKALSYKYLGYIATLNQQQKKAEEYYDLLFQLYPDFTIDYSLVSPKISSFFKDYQEIWLRLPSVKAKIYEISSKTVKYKSNLQLPIEWHDPNIEINQVIVNYKMSTEQTYSSAKFKDIKTQNYIAYFPLTFLEEPNKHFTLDYYVEIFDYDGEKIGTLGTLKEPRKIDIKIPDSLLGRKRNQDKDGKWYSSWWFISIVSVAIVGTIGGIVYATSSNGEVKNDPTLNIYITND